MYRLLAILLLLTGCASTQPYIDLSLGDNFDGFGDWYMDRDREWNCSEPPEFVLQIGVLHESGLYGYVYHESDVFCGTWNDRPEVDENGYRVGYRRAFDWPWL